MWKTDLTAARDKYSITVNDRLAKIDIKLKELSTKTDAKATAAATALNSRRTEIATKVGGIKDHAAADWDAFTKDVDTSFDKLESDISDALK